MIKRLLLKEIYKLELIESLSVSDLSFEVFDNNGEFYMDADSVAGLYKKGKIVGGLGLTKDDNCWVVETAWANDPISAYLLFVTALKHYKALMPSEMLTPASQSIIKRWYKKHHNDGSVSTIDKYEDKEAWRNSIYTMPPGVDSKVQIVYSDEPEYLVADVEEEFDRAYADPDRTGDESLDDLLKKNNFHQLCDILNTMLSKGDPLKTKTKKWIEENFYEITAIAKRNFNEKDIDFWNRVIAGRWGASPKI